ncbi:MAG TPA: tetratricopeptide repeat protein [Candidatus Acidoferrales bacterium]|nr:tetratricopeptide repeat protein [Candidatus Acidoferrales bacterium]
MIGIALAALLAAPAKGQQKNQAPPGPPPAGNSSGESSSSPNGPPAPPADSSSGESSSSSTPKAPPASDLTTYDPVTAEEDVEVGQFYVRKGDIDAAIGRFQDAIRLRSNFAKPRLLAAEAYEKKGDKVDAVKYYKEYLQVFPKAPDAKKIQSRIEKLSVD